MSSRTERVAGLSEVKSSSEIWTTYSSGVGILATELERQERMLWTAVGQEEIWMSHFPQNTASPPAKPSSHPIALLLCLELDTTCKLVNVYYLTLECKSNSPTWKSYNMF